MAEPRAAAEGVPAGTALAAEVGAPAPAAPPVRRSGLASRLLRLGSEGLEGRLIPTAAAAAPEVGVAAALLLPLGSSTPAPARWNAALAERRNPPRALPAPASCAKAAAGEELALVSALSGCRCAAAALVGARMANGTGGRRGGGRWCTDPVASWPVSAGLGSAGRRQSAGSTSVMVYKSPCDEEAGSAAAKRLARASSDGVRLMPPRPAATAGGR